MRQHYLQGIVWVACLLFSWPVQSKVDAGRFAYLPPDSQGLFELNAVSLKKAFEDLTRELANSPVYKDSVRFSSVLRQQLGQLIGLVENTANAIGVSYVDVKQVTGAVYQDQHNQLGFVVVFDNASNQATSLSKSQKTKLFGAQVYSLAENRYAFADQHRWIVTSSKALLQRALLAKEDNLSVYRRHPAFRTPLKPHWMRMSLSVPQLVRPIMTAPQVQLMRTLLSSLRRVELFVGEKTLLRLECIDAMGAERARLFLLGLGRLTQGLTSLVRSSVLGFLALDPSFATMANSHQMLLSQRPLLIRTVVQRFGPIGRLAQVSREQRRVEMRLGQGLGKSLVASVGIVLALMSPSYLGYPALFKQVQSNTAD